MTLKTKTLIDAWVGIPLVWALNLLAMALGRLISRRHDFDPMHTIVVCKLMGLGSIVQLTPLLASLRARFPTARLILLTRPANVDYCGRIGMIDEIRVIDDRSLRGVVGSIVGFLLACRREVPDLFVNLEVFSHFAALLTILSCARNRLGYYLQPRDMRERGVYTHIVYFNREAPIAQIYLQAARCLGIEALDPTLLRPRLRPADHDGLTRTLAAAGVRGDGFAVFNPNASDLRAERRWPAASFAALIARVHAARPDLTLLVTGGPGEEEVGRTVVRGTGLGPPVLCDLSGTLKLGELLVLLTRARLFVTNDSGPMHLALSLATPTVALFGPVSPAHYGGTAGNPRLINLSHRVYCSPCVHQFREPPCHGDNQCMKLIGVDTVFAAVTALLDGTPWTVAAPDLHYQSAAVVFGVQQRAGRP